MCTGRYSAAKFEKFESDTILVDSCISRKARRSLYRQCSVRELSFSFSHNGLHNKILLGKLCITQMNVYTCSMDY